MIETAYLWSFNPLKSLIFLKLKTCFLSFCFSAITSAPDPDPNPDPPDPHVFGPPGSRFGSTSQRYGSGSGAGSGSGYFHNQAKIVRKP